MKRHIPFITLTALLILPLAGQAVPYFQNYVQDNESLTVEYHYCKNAGFDCVPAPQSPATIAPKTAYQVPPSPSSDRPLVEIISAHTADDWVYTGPSGVCNVWFSSTPEFANFSKSLVSNVLQCSRSVGAAKKPTK
jgi:hypothetical protein